MARLDVDDGVVAGRLTDGQTREHATQHGLESVGRRSAGRGAVASDGRGHVLQHAVEDNGNALAVSRHRLDQRGVRGRVDSLADRWDGLVVQGLEVLGVVDPLLERVVRQTRDVPEHLVRVDAAPGPDRQTEPEELPQRVAADRSLHVGPHRPLVRLEVDRRRGGLGRGLGALLLGALFGRLTLGLGGGADDAADPEVDGGERPRKLHVVKALQEEVGGWAVLGLVVDRLDRLVVPGHHLRVFLARPVSGGALALLPLGRLLASAARLG